MKYLFLVILLVFVASCVLADDIVTMPTANQLKAGELDAAAYYLNLDTPAKAPQFVQYQTLYYGLTNKLEIDIHRSSVDTAEANTVLVGSYKLLSESPKTPDLVVGCRNLGGEMTSADTRSKYRSYFMAAAKTFFFNPAKPGAPLVRAHLGIGTSDWTLLGEERHKGIFGGLQFLLCPELGLVVEHDGQDLITGITIMPKNTGLTIKGGKFGDNTWVGIAYRRELSK